MQVVIRPHRPIRRALLLTLSVVVLIFAGWLLFDYGQWRYIYSRMSASDSASELWRLSRETANENTRLRQRLTVLENSRKIDREAILGLQERVGSQQSEILDLSEELDFYRGVVAGNRTREGYKIQSLKFAASAEPRRYRYRLVLTHAVKDDRMAKGVLRVALQGTEAESSRRLETRTLDGSGNSGVAFEFRHFRRFEGAVDLPESFEPFQVIVSVNDVKSNKKIMERIFDWAQVTE
jgi:hypothetical protein